MKVEIIRINGMTCSGCVSSVENVIRQLNGIHHIDVQLKPGQATIQYDPEKLDITLVKDAITNAGFDIVN